MDRVGADFDRVVSMMKENLGANAYIVNYPIGAEDQFKGVIDVVLGKQIIYNDDIGKSFDVTEISDEYKETYNKLREQLAEKAATTPSRTLNDRSTSTVKSTWPGVSIILIKISFQ